MVSKCGRLQINLIQEFVTDVTVEVKSVSSLN